MGRSKNRQRNKELGYPVKNFKSKTSPAAVRYRQRRKETKKTIRPYPCRHTGRTEFKKSLAQKLGLPEDTTFIFRDNRYNRREGDYLENLKLNSGTTAVIDKKDSSLVLAVRCNEFKTMTIQEREGFSSAISIPFLSARARNTNTLHNSIQLFILALLYWGWMGCCGWRGGSDPGKSLGTYAFNAFTSKKGEKIGEDKKRMTEFHQVRDFWAERFSTLCFSAFDSNLKLAAKAKIPGFDQLAWQLTNNGQVFASNLVVTCDGFRNCEHVDDYDHTRYSFGMFCLVDRDTGVPYQVEGSERKEKVKGGCFLIEDFGIEVDFEGCDGVIEMVWDTRVPHYSDPSVSFDCNGSITPPPTCKITRFGSSCQISESLVERIQILESKRGNMSDHQWELFVREQVKYYEDECEKKYKVCTNKNMEMSSGQSASKSAKKRAKKKNKEKSNDSTS